MATIVAAENVFEPRVHVFGLKHCLHFVDFKLWIK